MRLPIFLLCAALSGCICGQAEEKYVDPFAVIDAGDREALERFLEAGLEPNTASHNKGSLLNYAVLRRRYEIVDLLVDKGAMMHSEPYGRVTPLVNAISLDDSRILDTFLSSCPACINDRHKGFTLLMIAAMEGAVDSLEYLLDSGANADALSTGAEPRTALFYAVANKKFNAADVISSRADTSSKDRCGPWNDVTEVIKQAREHGKEDVAMALVKYCSADDRE